MVLSAMLTHTFPWGRAAASDTMFAAYRAGDESQADGWQTIDEADKELLRNMVCRDVPPPLPSFPRLALRMTGLHAWTEESTKMKIYRVLSWALLPLTFSPSVLSVTYSVHARFGKLGRILLTCVTHMHAAVY